jgi:RND family efflux transporter MFP subunit
MTTDARRRALRVGAFVLVLAVVLAWAMGLFHGGRIAPGPGEPAAGEAAPGAEARAARGDAPIVEDAVGTVRSRRHVTVAAQTVARVVEVAVQAGDTVRTGQLLVRLDDAEVAARFARTEAQYARVRRFVAAEAATREQLETAEAEYRQAKAGLDHTRILAPLDGVVAERHAEPGDLASPGRALLEVFDPSALRIEAHVREGVVGRLAVGARLPVVLQATDRTVEGVVAAILPAADARTRTFEVRVDLPSEPGIAPGMFGRLRVPIGARTVVRVPTAAVTRVGQIESVLVRDGEAWRRRLVTTGERFDDGTVEVLSGLAGGETVGSAPAGDR